jgi:hypothetical protein
MRPYPQRTRFFRGARRGRFAAAPVAAAIPAMIVAGFAGGMLLAWAEVSLTDIVWHPWWSLRRLAAGMADGLLHIGWGTLQALIVVVPIWLVAVVARGARRSV